MNRIKNELNALVNRGVDRHLRLAVTGLSRSGKTAFITAMVNQLLSVNNGARLPMLGAAREERLLGVKRVPQRDLGIQRFTYDEGLAQLYGNPPAWPTPTRGVSEMRLALRYRSNDSLLRHFKDTSTLYLEIVDYPGEWLLDLPMLAQDYLSWSRQMTGLLQGDRAAWSATWRKLCAGLDPHAPADENRLAAISEAWTDYLLRCKREGLHFIQPGRFVLPGDMAGAPALQFFPWPDVDSFGESKLAQADKTTNLGMLRSRFDYYCEKVVKGFYKNHFLRFDRQIVLVDCLQPLNSGPQAFNDMRLALTQLMQSFQYGQRTLFRRLFSPVIDKLLFAATKADHVTVDQHANMVSLLQQLVQDAWQNAAFEGIARECMGIASVQATQSGLVDVQGEQIPALRGNRLSDGAPLTVYPGEVPSRLPGSAFWEKQGFQFEQFRPQVMDVDKPLPHIRLDAALEFLIGDKLR
ncbi:YcjX family protein [Enterobacter sp. R1(2018)]|uniref:YcjX family protein n=1 Tax=Enterobacter sp. R1(2018) TaxID=2447891 RepID=UPI000EACDE81|nr:YcjX family protein [Enterobacter sp. R1(2018)]RKQ38833.1 YcjX family protein [Enterobacter sp. R1(2018)]